MKTLADNVKALLAGIFVVIATITITIFILFVNYILMPIVGLLLLGYAAFKITKENNES